MKVGSIVETKADFEELRRIWGFDYPIKGQLLTVDHKMKIVTTMVTHEGDTFGVYSIPKAKKESRVKTALTAIILLVLMASCADTVDVQKCLPEEPYGFWSGLWHGWIVVFSWIGSLFSDDIAIYAVNNNGGWYDFGFILGIGGLGWSGGKASK